MMRAEKESINGNKEKEGEFLLRAENGFIQELGEHEEEYVPKWEF